MICVFRFGLFAFSGYVPKVFRANNLPGAFFVFNVFAVSKFRPVRNARARDARAEAPVGGNGEKMTFF